MLYRPNVHFIAVERLSISDTQSAKVFLLVLLEYSRRHSAVPLVHPFFTSTTYTVPENRAIKATQTLAFQEFVRSGSRQSQFSNVILPASSSKILGQSVEIMNFGLGAWIRRVTLSVIPPSKLPRGGIHIDRSLSSPGRDLAAMVT